jgi:2-oxoglutarate dehydrogenase E1 component
MSDSLRALLDSSPLGAGNAPYVESLYEQFLADPSSVEPAWREYFRSLGGTNDAAHGPIREALAERASRPAIAAASTSAAAPAATDNVSAKQASVARLVQVYANRGHLLADIDPLGLMRRPVPEVLELEHFGLSQADLDTEFYTGQPHLGDREAHEAPRHRRAAAPHLLRHDRRGVRARLGFEGAVVAAGSFPGRPCAEPLFE